MRTTYLLVDSAAVAGVVGTACLLVLVGLQRQRAAVSTSPVLTSWEQIPARASWAAVIAGAITLVLATLLRATDPGWAAVVIFVGVALTADLLVRAGAEAAG